MYFRFDYVSVLACICITVITSDNRMDAFPLTLSLTGKTLHGDVLAWELKKRYLSQVVIARWNKLAVPFTSAPSERVLTTSGLTVIVKRSSLAPSSVDKVEFNHENAFFGDDSFE